MLDLLSLIPAVPFAGFLILAILGRRFSKTAIALLGTGFVGISALLSVILAIEYSGNQPSAAAYTQTLWTWMQFDGYAPAIAFTLDPLSLVMMLVITCVGFLIALYSTEFMQDDEGYSRFFAFINLFVGFMLTLVLADNLILLYLGWEGVGLCSYLLIGFWYHDPANGRAARKAFIVTRIGDTALLIGLFLLFTNLGTLTISELMQRASAQWPVGSGIASIAALLLLGGAVGKSAQLPLQVWLPDAMAGPSPVSALIHAATMVTAGVYLIARTHVLFTLAPSVQFLVALVGLLTLLLAGFTALTQRDLKRVLAYSTISQIGYMFLALGVGAWSAAMFHFMTHAFFKALLFLAAGIVILAQHHEHDMFKMGGLRKKIPVLFWTFLIGSASLSALPLITAGFYSKDMILLHAFTSPSGSRWLWLGGVAGAMITSLYTFRMVFLTFYGESKTAVSYKPGIRMMLPLAVLAVLSLTGGFIDLPETLGHLPLFSQFLSPVFGAIERPGISLGLEVMLQLTAALVSVAGIFFAWILFYRSPKKTDAFMKSPTAASVHQFWFSGWGFDRLYDFLFVRPFVFIARVNRNDIVDAIYTGIATAHRGVYGMVSLTQNGNIRWYAAGLVLGAVAIIGIVIFIR